MTTNIIGFLGQACLIIGGVGCLLYGLLWIIGRVRRESGQRWII